MQAKNLFDLLKEFFALTYKPDKKEYWIKLTNDHLLEIVRQIEIFMSKNYLNPDTVKDRIKPLAELNNQLQTCLRIAVGHAHMIYTSCTFEKGASEDDAEKNWQHDIQNDKGWVKVFALLEALELHDPKQKESDDAELENNGN